MVLELTNIALSILKANVICLAISYGIYFIRDYFIEDHKVVLSKQLFIILFATFINGYLTSIFTEGLLTASIISGLCFIVFDNLASIILSIVIDQSKIAAIIADYRHNLYGTKENLFFSSLYFVVTIILSIIGWLLFLVMKYFHR